MIIRNAHVITCLLTFSFWLSWILAGVAPSTPGRGIVIALTVIFLMAGSLAAVWHFSWESKLFKPLWRLAVIDISPQDKSSNVYSRGILRLTDQSTRSITDLGFIYHIHNNQTTTPTLILKRRDASAYSIGISGKNIQLELDSFLRGWGDHCLVQKNMKKSKVKAQ